MNYKKPEPKKHAKVKGGEDTKVVENMILPAIYRYKEKFEKQM